MAVRFHASEHSFEFSGPLFGRQERVYTRYFQFSQSTSWEPSVNIYEDEERFYVCVDLAGLRKEEVGVEVTDQEIRISGERPVPVPCNPLNPQCILRMEINSGRFFRAIKLPSRADMNTTQARLDNGFLWITVNKQAAQAE